MQLERIEIICSNTNAKCKKCKNKSSYHILDYKNSNSYSTSEFFNNDVYYNLCNPCIKKMENQYVD